MELFLLFFLFFVFFLWCDNENQQKVLWLSQNMNSTFGEIRIGYHKIPKISPGAYIFQRPFLRGLYSEGLIYGGKFAFQNQLG